MTKNYFFLFLYLLILLACQNQEKIVEKEPWIEKPVSISPTACKTYCPGEYSGWIKNRIQNYNIAESITLL
jgi:hypothetical protein